MKHFLALILLAIPFSLSSIIFAQDLLRPKMNAKDVSRQKISISLKAVAKGFNQITDIKRIPVYDQRYLILEKEGGLYFLDLGTKERRKLAQIEVVTHSELGLLGAAFAPFSEIMRSGGIPPVYLSYNVRKSGELLSKIAEWDLDNFKNPKEKRTLLEVTQPYANHNGGQIAFGLDAKLYIGFGDGGSAGDPGNRALNPNELLGKILRIDPVPSKDGKPYSIPADNPFVRDARYRPEIWALGLRNPWKFSVLSHSQIIAADVGQNKWEEISIIERGGNYGWNRMEAAHCFKPPTNCDETKYIKPIYEYDHSEGVSITGGFVYRGGAIPELKGLYVFGDFGSGRLWALNLKTRTVSALGQFEIQPSTFAVTPSGELLIGDFSKGIIYELAPAK